MCCQELQRRKKKSHGKYDNLILLSSGVIVICGIIQSAACSNNHDTREGANIPPTVAPLKRNKPPTLPCGAVKDLQADDEYFIESPDFKGRMRYPNSVRCDWKFKADGCNMGINCPDFQLADFLCFDHLDIVDQNGTMNRFCGKKGPKEMGLAENVTITFTSSSLFSDVGFRCRVVCRMNEDPNSGSPFPKPEAEPSNCECGETNTKIVGGNETVIAHHPWQAGLVRKGSSRPFCGGSLINSKYILTAAHCVYGRTPYTLEVIFNVTYVNSVGSQRMEVRRGVENILMHKKYNSKLDYDAALLRLSEPIDLSRPNTTTWNTDIVPSPLPVCLPTEHDLQQTYAGLTATVTGWGLTTEDGELSNVLMQAEVKVITNEECKMAYPTVTDRMLCAHTPGKDACQGDSGGPLVVSTTEVNNNTNSYTDSLTHRKMLLIGIVSWGQGCAEKPGVYTRVTELLSWIAINAKDGSYCSL